MVGGGEEAGILVDAMEKIGLLIVVGGEDNVVYDSFEDLRAISSPIPYGSNPSNV